MPHRIAEHTHLPTGIIEIIFTGYVEAIPFQQTSDGIAQYRLPTVTDT